MPPVALLLSVQTPAWYGNFMLLISRPIISIRRESTFSCGAARAPHIHTGRAHFGNKIVHTGDSAPRFISTFSFLVFNGYAISNSISFK
jgi:hypothetical protein